MDLSSKLTLYPKYKDSGVEWIGKVPEGWVLKKLKHICSKSAIYGANIESDEYLPDGVRFIRTTDITEDGELTPFSEGVFINPDLARGYILEDGDVLFSRSGTLGRCFIYSKEKFGKCAYAGYLVKFKVNSKNNPYFIYYFSKSKSFDAWMETVVIESTIGNINGQKYGNLYLATPPIAEQNHITSFLDKKTAEIDALIVRDRRLIDLLREKRASMINHAVTKGLDPKAKMKDSGVEWIGEIPEGWSVKPLKYFSQIVLGKMLTGADSGGDHLRPYLRAQNILWEKTDLSDVREMWFSSGELNTFKLKENDLLVSEGGEAGRTALWKGEVKECYIQNSVQKVTLDKCNDPLYFMFLLKHVEKQDISTPLLAALV